MEQPSFFSPKDEPLSERNKLVRDMLFKAWDRLVQSHGIQQRRPQTRGEGSRLNACIRDRSWRWQEAILWMEDNLPSISSIRSEEASNHFLQQGEDDPLAGTRRTSRFSFQDFTRSTRMAARIADGFFLDGSSELQAVIAEERRGLLKNAKNRKFVKCQAFPNRTKR